MNEQRTILVVDDDADVRGAVADVLADSGYRVLTAEHGRAALGALAVPETVDLILVDLMMPVMDGLTFAAERRKEPRLARIPLVLFSADPSCEQLAEPAGAVACLRKPFNLERMFEVVNTVLAPSHAADWDAGLSGV